MQDTQLMMAMIEECSGTIQEHEESPVLLQKPLRKAHLLWMCTELIDHLDTWTVAKQNRWIGFIQCAMIAHGMLDLEGAMDMFARAKNAFGESSQDLIDHLAPDSTFSFDLGGEG
jgi:hypothetical protein